MFAELLRHPLVAWIATYLAHSTLLCAAAMGFELWSRRQPARERALGIARERLWKLALFLPLLSTFVQCGGELSLWRLPAAEHLAPAAASPLSLIETPLFEAALDQAQPAPARAASFHFSWADAALSLWIAGVLGGALLWLREWRALGRAMRELVPCADGELLAEFDALRAGDPALSSTRLFSGRHVLAPLTLGWIHMRVVVPLRAARELDPDECRAMLAHELAHARRRDPLWISVARVVEGLFFFQPLNRLARLRLQDEAEFLADRWAIERGVEPLSLASCLTEVAGWIVSQRRALPVPSMAARGARLTRRVERLLEERRSPLPLRSAPWSLAFLALALCSAAAAVPGRPVRAVRTPTPVVEPAVTSAAEDVRAPDAAPAAVADPIAAADELADQFESLANDLDDLASEADERELDARWHRRLAALRSRLEQLKSSYTLLRVLAQEPPAPPQSDSESEPTTDP